MSIDLLVRFTWTVGLQDNVTDLSFSFGNLSLSDVSTIFYSQSIKANFQMPNITSLNLRHLRLLLSTPPSSSSHNFYLPEMRSRYMV